MKKIRLDTVCEITAGQGAPQGENSYSSEGIPFVKAGDLVNLIAGKKENEIQKVSEEVAKEKKLKLFPAGSVLFAKSGMSCMKGHVYQLKDSAYVVSHLAVIMPRNIDSNFLRYYFTFDKPNKLVQDAAYPAISLKDIASLEIPHPPLPDQQKIAAHLDSIQSAIDNKKQQLQQLDELVKSKFVEMFGDLNINSMNWAVVNFDDAAKIDGSMTKDYEKYADYPHIGIDSIMKNTGELIGYRTVKEDNVISGKYIFTDKHIIYSKIRPNLNKVALPTFEGLCSADSYPILVNSEKCNRYYLAYVMRSDFFLTYILAHASRAGMPKVNREQIRGFNFPLPPIELQNTFAEYVQKIDSAKSIIKTQIVDLQELIDSKMNEYFGG